MGVAGVVGALWWRWRRGSCSGGRVGWFEVVGWNFKCLVEVCVVLWLLAVGEGVVFRVMCCGVLICVALISYKCCVW